MKSRRRFLYILNTLFTELLLILEDYFDFIGFHSGRKAVGLNEILVCNLNYYVESRSEYCTLKKVIVRSTIL